MFTAIWERSDEWLAHVLKHVVAVKYNRLSTGCWLRTYSTFFISHAMHVCYIYFTLTNKNQPNVGRYASPMDGRYGYGICTLTRLKGFKSRFTKIQPHKCGGLGRDRVQADEWPHTKSEMVMGPWRCKHVSLITHPDTQWFRMISKIRKSVSWITFKKMFKTHWMVQQKWATLWPVRFLPESSSYRMRKWGNKSITWPFFVTFLGWWSDPFNGESWPPNRGYKGHFESPGTVPWFVLQRRT